MKRIFPVLASAFVLLVFIAGCEKEEEVGIYSQADWTAEGWKYWVQGNPNLYEDALRAFGNALKVDPYYAEAYGGQGWTYLRMQDYESAVNVFEDAILIAEQTWTPLKTKQLIYMGAATAYEALDEYAESAERGRYMANNLRPETWRNVFYDRHVSDYDLYIILALDYYGLADKDNCVWAINKMRAIVGEQPNYQFTTWEAATREINRLVEKDPT